MSGAFPYSLKSILPEKPDPLLGPWWMMEFPLPDNIVRLRCATGPEENAVFCLEVDEDTTEEQDAALDHLEERFADILFVVGGGEITERVAERVALELHAAWGRGAVECEQKEGAR